MEILTKAVRSIFLCTHSSRNDHEEQSLNAISSLNSHYLHLHLHSPTETLDKKTEQDCMRKIYHSIKASSNQKNCVPIISFVNMTPFQGQNVTKTAAQIFDEGTSSFACTIFLSLVELGTSNELSMRIQDDFSIRVISATLDFDQGVCKARKSDHVSAATYFHRALTALVVDQSVLDNFPDVTFRENAYVTISFLTSLTLLNLGHAEWHLNNPNESINFYHRCMDSFKSFQCFLQKSSSISSFIVEEAIFYCNYGIAACLNCISMVLLNKDFVTLIGTEDEEQMQEKGKTCLKHFKASLSIFKDIESSHDASQSLSFVANMATVLNNLGRVYFILSDYKQALCCYQDCVDKRLLSLPHTHLDLGVSYFNLAQTIQTLGYEYKALEYYRTFLSIATPTLGHAHTYIVKTVLIVADLYICEEDYDNAESILQEHLSSSAFISIEDLKSKITLLHALGEVFNAQDKIQDTLETLIHVRNIVLPLPEDNFLIQRYVANSIKMAHLLVQTGKFEEALLLYKRAMKKLEKYEQEQKDLCSLTLSGLLAELHMNTARIYEAMTNISACILHLEEAISFKRIVLGPTNVEVANLLNYLGLMYYKADKYDSALSSFLECLKIRTHCKKKNNSAIFSTLYNIATIYKEVGESKKALQSFLVILRYERKLFEEERSSANSKDLILTLRHVFELYDRDPSLGMDGDGTVFIFEAMQLCRQYSDIIEPRIGRGIFFLLGHILTSNQEVEAGFKYYCEGCELFGALNSDDIHEYNQKGLLSILLAQVCNESRVFPLHAAAA